ncbi:hypothetical protein FPK15_contig00002-0076 [Flavobacterium psychrophilum]|nr:hypothetical protein [Flavobacterium psychrophilum]GAQ47910.1 hypothetical protein FPK15_contig00002-0076 [Flavobacterium psychrophilum]GAW88324.1 hypothetical protein FPS14_contig00003-0089 [Flavobacterium psychrophilum]
MFIKYIKEISLKKILKRSLHNVKPSLLTTPILTVGLVIDESYFSDKEQLTKELVACGVKESNIKMIVFRDKIKKMKLSLSPHLVIMI